MEYRIFLLTSILFLTACAPTTPSRHGGISGGHTPTAQQEDAQNLTVLDQSTDSEIAFSVRDGGETFTDYGVSHTKEMHLITVRDDLRQFNHLHPERNADGVWRIAFLPPAGGTYWRFADFVDAEENSYTIRFDRKYPGDLGEYGLRKNFERVKTVDGYRFEVEPELSGDEVTFTYKISDMQGQPAELEEYLGATGHSVLLSPPGDFIHTHPSEETATPMFATSLPSDDFYRVFTQFRIAGKVVTVSFDWQPAA